jgi:hypothetical protein
MNAASDPPLSTPPPSPVPAPAAAQITASFTAGEVSQRRRLYLQTAILANLIGSLTSLASLSDTQLDGMRVFRWVLTVLLLILGAWLAGNNALRAAIDRSTSAPGKDPAAP